MINQKVLRKVIDVNNESVALRIAELNRMYDSLKIEVDLLRSEIINLKIKLNDY